MTHAWHDVIPGIKLPREFTTVIEIPVGSNVKYELDKATGLLKLDRILYSSDTTPPMSSETPPLLDTCSGNAWGHFSYEVVFQRRP